MPSAIGISSRTGGCGESFVSGVTLALGCGGGRCLLKRLITAEGDVSVVEGGATTIRLRARTHLCYYKWANVLVIMSAPNKTSPPFRDSFCATAAVLYEAEVFTQTDDDGGASVRRCARGVGFRSGISSSGV